MTALTSSLIAPFERVAGARGPSQLEQEVLGLFDQLRNPMLRYLISVRIPAADAEEIVQEAFLLLFRHLRAGKGRENLRAWLFSVSHNLALRYYVRSRREAAGEAPERRDPDPDPAERLEMLELQEYLQAAVTALPEQDQRCLALRAEGLRYRDIAQLLGISLGSVANSLARSLGKLGRRASQGVGR